MNRAPVCRKNSLRQGAEKAVTAKAYLEEGPDDALSFLIFPLYALLPLRLADVWLCDILYPIPCTLFPVLFFHKCDPVTQSLRVI